MHPWGQHYPIQKGQMEASPHFVFPIFVANQHLEGKGVMQYFCDLPRALFFLMKCHIANDVYTKKIILLCTVWNQ